ncbi:MAG: N-acetylmuramoyl-L-alanine amidase [Eubacteriales bacterium]|nr:N-acetylmuramoyl-L-alanine amidase [Eubacteriales bacterium]MDD3199126.1 N-acetylmuramoyl-L-alanine amidase [Eubacteriales bacterium]MDD4629631.1 N-acetylmuramoyl-L-alanine amidase [Eubacteriales bacterium]
MKSRLITNKKLKWSLALIILAAVLILSLRPVYDNIAARVQAITGSDVLLIDPGHGGMDGGAESAAGVTEKDINLSIAKYIKELAEADGWKVVMTREEDIGLGDTKSRTIRSKKTADLITRREMIREVNPLAAVSIHLNSFKQDRSVRGAQTFYPSDSSDKIIHDESKRLAEAIQEQLITGIADGTDRVALGKRDLLMFNNPTVPMAIVECGFLSNAEEAKLLANEEYQRKLARYIYEGILTFTGKEHSKPIKAIDSRG